MKSFFAALLVCCCASVAHAADIRGTARALDGHTLDVGGVVVRLYGIQAPHPAQTCRTRKGQQQQCGNIATMGLAEMVRGPELRCKDKGAVAEPAAQGRPQAARLGLCFIGWMNLSEEMVASGYALADPVSGADFKRAEAFAKARKEGLWRTEFTNPWEWRGDE